MSAAPRDPGIKPGGIRERALRVLEKRGPLFEDKEKTAASQAYWAAFKRAARTAPPSVQQDRSINQIADRKAQDLAKRATP
jgi:hypothetical protein